MESFLGMPGKAKLCFPVGEGPEDSEPQPLRADSELMVSLAAPSRVPVTGNLLKECWLKGPLGCHLSCTSLLGFGISLANVYGPQAAHPLLDIDSTTAKVVQLALSPCSAIPKYWASPCLSLTWVIKTHINLIPFHGGSLGLRHTALPGMARWVTVPNYHLPF